MYSKVKIILDFLIALIAFIICFPIIIVIAILIKLESKGPVFFLQKRVGKDKKIFDIYKFRTMRTDTPKDMPTHLLNNPDLYITKIGKILRKTSLDELPQLINILKGEMSFVGPRPALWNQEDLIKQRDKYNANSIKPGITGLAQINGRDELDIPVKAKYDGEYVEKQSFLLDTKIFFKTFAKVLKKEGIVEGKKQNKPESDKLNIWLVKANEPMPVTHPKDRLFRMGLIAQELSRRGHNITWFGTTFDHFKKEQLFKEDTSIDVNDHYKLKLIWAPSYKKNISVKRIINHKYIAIKFRKIAKELEKPDLILVSFPTIDFAEEAIRYGQKNNVPAIVDIRDLWPDIFKHNLSKLMGILAMPYIKLMDYKTQKIMKKAYALFSISPLMAEWGAKKAGRELQKKDKAFFMGYTRKNNEVELEKKIENFDESKFNICFFGTMGNQFDFDMVLEVSKLIKDEDIRFIMCGDGPELEDIKKKFKEEEKVTFFGWAGKSELNYILNNSKIGLAPYKNTFDFQMSISNKFAEYLSYGLPIVLTSTGYMGDFAKEKECGFESRSAKEICEYIMKLKKDEEKYQIISDNAKKTYEENFIAEKIYSELVDYLEEINKKF